MNALTTGFPSPTSFPLTHTREQSLPILCLSHLRWRFVYQRPQHLMSRFARERRVYFCEEPIRDGAAPSIAFEHDASGVTIVTPYVPADRDDGQVDGIVRGMLASLVADVGASGFVLWYLTPMALAWTRDLRPAATVFDCMDDLSSFAFAPQRLRELETELLARADVVFTGGRSLYESRRTRHANVHCCPSSVDLAHFGRARTHPDEPADQRGIPAPRIGFAGVIDERMDMALIDAVARLRPDWQFVLIGPVAKIDPGTIPRHSNVHRLGEKAYEVLPSYLAHWDVGMLPFAHNDATRFISPTKTPEYLAAGLPAVSTSIRDVVTPYGELGLVGIADTPEAFVDAIAAALAANPAPRQMKVDAYLSHRSWDSTWAFMRDQLAQAVQQRTPAGLEPVAAETPLARTATVIASRGMDS